MIGLAGFNYEFNSLRDHDLPPNHPDANVLLNALERMLNTTVGWSLPQLLRVEIPVLKYVLRFDQRWKDYEYAGKAFREVTKQIIEAARRKIKEEAKAGENGVNEKRSGKTGSKSKDLMSVILRTAVGEDGETISDKEAGNQIPTFILGGECPTFNHPRYGN
jgi:cytochrome P450